MDVLGFLRSFGPYQPMATIMSLTISALIGFKALRRTDVREHHRWLQEKRREAYVNFLSEARKAYRTISDPEPETGSEHRDALMRDEDDVNYALDVLRIVGPRSMAEAGEHVVARLKLDRLLYSPTRDQQLLDSKDRYIQRAHETGDPAFARGFEELYGADSFDSAGYLALHDKHPLRGFWQCFAEDAEKELAKPYPKRWWWAG